MDFLMWRTKGIGMPTPQRDLFPWLLWYIWKARNDKFYNGKEVSALDTLQLATLEKKSWNLANRKETSKEIEDEEIEDGEAQDHNNSLPTLTPQRSICQVDASWIDHGQISGLGWRLRDNKGTVSEGAKACRQCISALRAEFESLIWAIDCLREQSIPLLTFETDCADLTRMLQEPDDWPIFKSELELFFHLNEAFIDFHIQWIPRDQNVCVDALAKGARAQGSSFSHVNHNFSIGDNLTITPSDQI